MRIRLKTLLGLVLGAALALGFYVSFVHNPPWNRSGGMIGWSRRRSSRDWGGIVAGLRV